MPNPPAIYIVFHLCSISLCLVIGKRKQKKTYYLEIMGQLQFSLSCSYAVTEEWD